MPSAKTLVVQTAFGKSLGETLLLALHPDESHDDNGDPLPNARTIVLELRGDKAVFREELPIPLYRSWYSTSGAAYCSSVESGALHRWQGGTWSSELFSKKSIDFVSYVYGVPGKKPDADTLFVATEKHLFVRQAGKWLRKRVPGEGFPYQMTGTQPNEVYVGATDVLLWDGTTLSEIESPEDDNMRGLTLTADDRLVGGRTYVSVSTPDGEWERIDTPVEGFHVFTRLGDTVYALSDEDGVLSVYPGKPKVLTKPLDSLGLVNVGDGLVAYGNDGVLAFDGKKWTKIKIPACAAGKRP